MQKGLVMRRNALHQKRFKNCAKRYWSFLKNPRTGRVWSKENVTVLQRQQMSHGVYPACCSPVINARAISEEGKSMEAHKVRSEGSSLTPKQLGPQILEHAT